QIHVIVAVYLGQLPIGTSIGVGAWRISRLRISAQSVIELRRIDCGTTNRMRGRIASPANVPETSSCQQHTRMTARLDDDLPRCRLAMMPSRMCGVPNHAVS